MPESRVRKKKASAPPPARSAKHAVSPAWLAPTMVACFVLGLVWISLYYVTQGNMPGLRSLNGWNLVGGFGLIVIGVVLATRWH